MRADAFLRSLLRPVRREVASRPEREILDRVAAGGGRFERVVFTRNRRVMASVSDGGRTLRIHELFRSAPPEVFAAIGTLFSRAGAAARQAARRRVLEYCEQAGPGSATSHRPTRPAPAAADRRELDRLQREFDRVNEEYFRGRLPRVTLRLSGRMRRRNGHFSAAPLEIVISRRLCTDGVAGEAERTLRHEMIHLWQWIEGRKPGHLADFRRWARRLDIHPRASRAVSWAGEGD